MKFIQIQINYLFHSYKNFNCLYKIAYLVITVWHGIRELVVVPCYLVYFRSTIMYRRCTWTVLYHCTVYTRGVNSAQSRRTSYFLLRRVMSYRGRRNLLRVTCGAVFGLYRHFIGDDVSLDRRHILDSGSRHLVTLSIGDIFVENYLSYMSCVFTCIIVFLIC